MEQNMNNIPEPYSEPPTGKKARKKADTGLTVRTASGIAILPPALDIIRNMARLGHSVPGIAAALGISRETLNQCRKRQPDVDEAIAQGHAGLEHELVDLLLKMARSGNVAAAIFLGKAKAGLRETGPSEGGPKVAVQINLPGAMDERAYMHMVEAASQGSAADE